MMTKENEMEVMKGLGLVPHVCLTLEQVIRSAPAQSRVLYFFFVLLGKFAPEACSGSLYCLFQVCTVVI